MARLSGPEAARDERWHLNEEIIERAIAKFGRSKSMELVDLVRNLGHARTPGLAELYDALPQLFDMDCPRAERIQRFRLIWAYAQNARLVEGQWFRDEEYRAMRQAYREGITWEHFSNQHYLHRMPELANDRLSVRIRDAMAIFTMHAPRNRGFFSSLFSCVRGWVPVELHVARTKWFSLFHFKRAKEL